MRFLVAASALAAIASALPEQQNKRQDASPTPIDTFSILNLLATALPESVLQLAYTAPAALSSEIASEFAAHQTPSWFSALPTDVQMYLVPATSTSSTSISAASATASSVAQITAAPYPGLAGNSTAGVGSATGLAVPTTAGPNAGSGVHTVGAPSSSRVSLTAQSTGAAAVVALPSAVIGVGFAGVLGVMGLLAV